MIIGVDMYARQIFKTGVRVVIDNLLAAWQRNHPEHTFVELQPGIAALPTSRNAYAQKLFNHVHRVAWTQVGLPLAARRNKCDLLFASCMFGPYVQPIPTVTLIYDMAIWRHPEWYPRFWRAMNYWFTEVPARWTPQLVTISEDARRDILHYFRVPPERVQSIHLGIDLPNVPAGDDTAVLSRYDLPPGAEYILYFGPVIPHKNLPGLVAAFGELVARLPDRPLYLVIGGPASNAHGKDNLAEVRAAAARAGVDARLRFTGFVPREHCTILYRNALMYAFPSFFEGFGLPLVEAMACGTPVVSSNLTSLPEVGGDAAVYFDPHNVQSIANAMHLVATQPALRRAMAQRGLARAEQFSWDRAAEAYVRLFETTLDHQRKNTSLAPNH
jgi:glycosyltransferase involved in cell wall biosynthesis